MKLAKTIQLDVSDNNVFPCPAKTNEWAITGTFSFVDTDPNEWSSRRDAPGCPSSACRPPGQGLEAALPARWMALLRPVRQV